MKLMKRPDTVRRATGFFLRAAVARAAHTALDDQWKKMFSIAGRIHSDPNTEVTPEEAFEALSAVRAAQDATEAALLDIAAVLSSAGVSQAALSTALGVRREAVSRRLAAHPLATLTPDNLSRTPDGRGWQRHPLGPFNEP